MEFHTKTFFIVDDHSVVRDGLRLAVSELAPNYEQVGEASSVATALEPIINLRPQVVFLDHFLQEQTGLELVQAVKKIRPEIEFVIVTQAEDRFALQQYIGLGVKALISKTNSREELRTILNSPKTREPYIAPSLKKVLSDFNSTEKITPREIEILKYIAKGHSNKEIAQILNCSEHTVKTHKVSIMRKLHCKTSVEISVWAIKHKLI